MNILLYVVAILFSLSLMTQARFQSFVEAQGLQYQIRHITESGANDYVSQSAIKKYENMRGEGQASKDSSEDKGDSDRSAVREPNLSRTLNIAVLFQNETHPAHGSTRDFFERLIQSVYGQQPFFKELESRNPDLARQLVDHILAVSQSQDESSPKVSTTGRLKNLDLGDEALQSVWYKMLSGSSPDARNSYRSLLDLVSVSSRYSTEKPISIYLAEREILQTIFFDTDTVNRLLALRYDLYLQQDRTSYEGGQEGRQRLEEELRSFVEQQAIDPEFQALLNYRVSGSAPKKA